MSFRHLISPQSLHSSVSSLVPELAMLVDLNSDMEEPSTEFSQDNSTQDKYKNVSDKTILTEPPYTAKRFHLAFAAELEQTKLGHKQPARLYGDQPDAKVSLANTPSGYVVNKDHVYITVIECFPSLNRLINFLNNHVCAQEAIRVRDIKFTDANLDDGDIVYQWLSELFWDPYRTEIIETLIDRLIERGAIGLVQDSESQAELKQKLSFIRYSGMGSGLDISFDQQRLPNHAILSTSEAIVRICATGFVENFVNRVLFRSKILIPSKADLLRVVVCLRDYADRLKPSYTSKVNRDAILKAIDYIKVLIESDSESKSKVYPFQKAE